tara:strand:- start:980 stop:1327 length:348 start_codon:yes stop_codon:yes gene_type:complete
MWLILFSAFLLAIIFTSCKKEKITETIDSIFQVETYSSVKTILEMSCLGGHSPNQNAYVVYLTNYQSFKNFLDATNTMIDKVNSVNEFYRMPPSGNLSDADKEKLIDWKNNGYLE